MQRLNVLLILGALGSGCTNSYVMNYTPEYTTGILFEERAKIELDARDQLPRGIPDYAITEDLKTNVFANNVESDPEMICRVEITQFKKRSQAWGAAWLIPFLAGSSAVELSADEQTQIMGLGLMGVSFAGMYLLPSRKDIIDLDMNLDIYTPDRQLVRHYRRTSHTKKWAGMIYNNKPGKKPEEQALRDVMDAFKQDLNLDRQLILASLGKAESPIVTPMTTIDTLTTTLADRPELSFSVKLLDSDSDEQLEGGEDATLEVTVTNTGKGTAQEVFAILAGDEDLVARFNENMGFGDIGPGKSVTRQASTRLPYDIKARTANIDVQVSEKSLGRLPKIERLSVACIPAQVEVVETQISSLVEVDVVPYFSTPDPNAYGVVIGISKYREDNIPAISYAENDAKIVASYFTNVLGVQPENLYTLYDERASYSDFEDLLRRILPNSTRGGKVLYFYYAGHGTPLSDEEGQGKAYLVPYDGVLGSQYKLYPTDTLYAALGALPVDNVVVFVDACFSGTGRSALASGQRPLIMTEIETVTWPSKLRVIAAAQSTQTALDYEEVKHGLFTYYLLDGLRGSGDANSDGYIEFGELYNYVHENVLRTSTKTLLKRQEPIALPEGSRGDLKLVEVR
ncbi:caspase family protein [candidate division WOR-3 bacterium]|nr:caspase family protein [candidate division WOR-3 bacterium]